MRIPHGIVLQSKVLRFLFFQALNPRFRGVAFILLLHLLLVKLLEK